MNLYLFEIKKCVDELIVVGAPICTKEHIKSILDGLPFDYSLIVTSIISRLDPYSIKEMEALLLVVEARVEHYHNQELGAQGFSSQVQANFAHTHGHGFPARGRGSNP